jgi:hypothetical protein
MQGTKQTQQRTLALDRDRRLERDLQVTASSSDTEKSASVAPAKWHV